MLFEPFSKNGPRMKNRFIRSATAEAMTGISCDAHLEGLKRLVEKVKKVDRDVLLVAQLAHAGNFRRKNAAVLFKVI
uniref:NADH:flavin oxidoreductase/NADH oxidase N-terminal domain-containing protein n=1 Tax=Archaeoglobus fulgidus TaxID=2234 RepID=A0A7J2TKQ6_ARCFL